MDIEWLFGRRYTPAEQLAAQREALQDVQRTLDRSARKADERAAKADTAARNNTKLGNMSVVRQYARERTRTLRHALAFRKMSGDIGEVLAATTLQESALGMQMALARIAGVMRNAARVMPQAQFNRIMAQYALDTAGLQLGQETALDAVDDALGDMEQEDGDAADDDTAVDAYLQEIGATEADKLLAQAPDVLGATGAKARTPKLSVKPSSKT
jgi:hypothetical protein